MFNLSLVPPSLCSKFQTNRPTLLYLRTQSISCDPPGVSPGSWRCWPPSGWGRCRWQPSPSRWRRGWRSPSSRTPSLGGVLTCRPDILGRAATFLSTVLGNSHRKAIVKKICVSTTPDRAPCALMPFVLAGFENRFPVFPVYLNFVAPL